MFELSNYKDVDSAVSSIVTQYYNLRDAGKYTEANQLIDTNREMLQHYYINAESFNKIELGIYDLARKQAGRQRIIVSDEEPTFAILRTGSLWLQKY